MARDVRGAKDANQLLMRILKKRPIPTPIRKKLEKELPIELDNIEDFMANHSFMSYAWGMKHVQSMGVHRDAKRDLKQFEAQLQFVIRKQLKAVAKGTAVREKDVDARMRLHQDYDKFAKRVENAQFLEDIMKVIAETLRVRGDMLRSLGRLVSLRREEDLQRRRIKEGRREKSQDRKQSSKSQWGTHGK